MDYETAVWTMDSFRAGML